MAKQPSATFDAILDTPATEVERPKPLPVGTYDTVIKGMPEHGESAQKKTPFVRFTHQIVAAHEDVDAAELEAMGGIADKTIRNTYYTTPTSLYRLTDFLEALGLDMEGKSIRQLLDETPNAEVRILVAHSTSDDGQSSFAEVKRAFRAE